MANDTEKASRSFVVYSFVVLLLGVCALVLTFASVPLRPTPQLAILVIAALLSENFTIRLASFSISLIFPLLVAALLVGGPAAAALAAAVSFTSLEEIRQHRPASAFAFNFGQLAITACFGGWVYVALGAPVMTGIGGVTPFHLGEVPLALTGVLVAAGAFSAMNVLLTGIAVRLGRGVPFATVLRSLLQYVPTQFALAFVGFLMAQVLAIRIVALLLFLFPLFLARQTYQRYASLREVYLDTVRSLIGALEVKDPYTRGHSERVSVYALQLGRHLELDDRGLEQLEKAALLHDIGKLALSGAILVKPDRLTDAEYGAILEHPAVGASMVSRILPLKALASTVHSHHERVDGSGYPRGLLGDSIPHDARLLAVADAYDAMTTCRAYRAALSHDDAIAELVRGAGTQFDTELVRAFIEAQIGRMHAEGPRAESARIAFGVLSEDASC